MKPNVTIEETRGVYIVRISGALALGEATAQFRQVRSRLLHGQPANILLDMAGVKHIDSAGIGELVAAHEAAARAGGEMKLLHLGRRVHEVIEITRLYAVFEAFEDELVALKSFPTHPPTDFEMRWSRFMNKLLTDGRVSE